MLRHAWILLASSAAVLAGPISAARDLGACRTLDAVTLDGAVSEEGLSIDPQFADGLGTAFSLQADGNPPPGIARTGSPATTQIVRAAVQP